jgi:hypothetical protein
VSGEFAPLVARSDTKREDPTSTIAGYILEQDCQDHLNQMSWRSLQLPARKGRISIAIRYPRWHIPELESRRVWRRTSVRRECSQLTSGISIVLAQSKKKMFRRPTMKFSEWALVPIKPPNRVDSVTYSYMLCDWYGNQAQRSHESSGKSRKNLSSLADLLP